MSNLIPAIKKAFGKLSSDTTVQKVVPLDEEIPQIIKVTSSDLQKRYYTIADLGGLRDYNPIAIDTETTGTERTCELLGISFCGEPFKSFWLPKKHIDFSKVREYLIGKTVIMHNAKFDLNVLSRHGVLVDDCKIFDTMIAAHLLDENRKHGLKDLAEELLQEKVIRFKDLTLQQDLFKEVNKLASYACADADYTFRLYELFKTELTEEGLDKLFYGMEMPLLKIVLKMENTGLALDTFKLTTLEKTYSQKLEETRKRIFEMAGEPFNLNSPQHLERVLYDKLKLPVVKRTPSQIPSTDNESLEAIKDKHEIVPLVLRFRELDKLLSTFIKNLPTFVNPEIGRIHCELNQIGTKTGRFSSSNPNLQNIPRDESLRKAFIAEKGHVFIDADFSQIELRVIAHYTQDNRLVWAYQNGIDVHKQTIAIILGKDIEQITKEERGLGKAINFGLCYGMGAKRFAKLNNLSLSDATLYRDGFFATYPAIKHALHHYNELAKEQGFIVNMFGRRRRFKNEDNTFDAFNSLIQGTAGDICKIAMIKLSKELPKEAKLLLQVHDELLFEVPKESASEIKALIISIMERPIKGLDGKEFSVPIKVDASIGETWADAKV